MAEVTQTFSQLLLTYGPGAMVDLPEHAVIVSGLQGWTYAGEDAFISEDRLVGLLKDQLGAKLSPNFLGLRRPPVQDEDRHDDRAPGVEVMVFPQWFTVDDTDDGHDAQPVDLQDKRRRMVQFSDLSVTKAGKLAYAVEKNKAPVNPIRFVAACTKGHLQDIDWRYLVHRSGDRSCRKPMHWVERGVSSDPSDISVRCTCGSFLTMADLYKAKFLGTCQCRSPWLPRLFGAEERCDNDLRLLPRSATNTYFAQTVTIISLTNSDDRLRQTVQDHRPTIDSIRALPNFIEVLRSLPATREPFAGFSDSEILQAIDAEAETVANTSPSASLSRVGRSGRTTESRSSAFHTRRNAVASAGTPVSTAAFNPSI